MTEPNATSTKFLLYGTQETKLLSQGVMYHLNFETLGQPLCKDKPSTMNQGSWCFFPKFFRCLQPFSDL